ncbi:MAG: prefoldin subunit beta [Fervidicoccaceae archaeon]|jgi:prefoldin beta subunit|uniref:Prefoldin subunit beta n=1 Tax=Fervidicoccus fontis TaxID=683846 RepID=A0A7C2YZ69_9CREN|nr:MAG: prefoldin subunit beta [Fervidicoccus sp.]HEU97620.1 prefoldin subunit beta [Fervidicoccus fontis]
MAEKVPPEIEQVAQQLDELQNRYTVLANQRVILENEVKEITRILEALQSLPSGTKVYRNVGNILFEEDRDKLLKELEDRKSTDELIVEKYKKEEDELKKQISSLQEKLKGLLTKYYQKVSTVAGKSTSASGS